MSDMGMVSSVTNTTCGIGFVSISKNSEEEEDSSVHLNSYTCHLAKLAFIEAVMIVCFACHTISPLQKVRADYVIFP